MSWRTKISEKILLGLHRACNDAIEFSEDYSRKIDAEYLLTVNVAKSIIELNKYIGFPLHAVLEHRTSKFASACLPLLGSVPASNFLGRQSVIRTKHNTTRRGRIDVAILEEIKGIEVPICAIELKGFNPGRLHIIKDLKRNLEYFHLLDQTGKSQIEFTAFAALHSFNRTTHENELNKDLDNLKRKYEIILSNFIQLEGIEADIDVSTISSRLARDDMYDFELEDLAHEGHHHFASVLVTFFHPKLELKEY